MGGFLFFAASEGMAFGTIVWCGDCVQRWMLKRGILNVKEWCYENYNKAGQGSSPSTGKFHGGGRGLEGVGKLEGCPFLW